MKSDRAGLREFAARYTAAWCSQDPSSVAAFYSPDGSLTVNNDAPAIGRDAILKVAQSFMSAFPDLHLIMDELLERNGRVEYHWTLTGTNTGPAGTGNRVHISGCERWRIGADGRISESLGRFDSSEFRRQLKSGVAGQG